MLIKTFWKILLKLIGLWLLLDCIEVISIFFSTLSYPVETILDIKSFAILGLILLTTIIIYIMIIRFFLLETDWIIDKFGLDKDFTEERIDLNIKSTTVLTITIIVIGGLNIIQYLPGLCLRTWSFLNQNSLSSHFIEPDGFIFDIIKIIIGFLFVRNGKRIAKYIEKNSH